MAHYTSLCFLIFFVLIFFGVSEHGKAFKKNRNCYWLLYTPGFRSSKALHQIRSNESNYFWVYLS